MLIRLLPAVALSTFVSAQAALTRPRTVDDLLPASTYAAFRFGGIEACNDATGQMPLTRLAETMLGRMPEEVRGRIMEDGLEQMSERVRQGLQQAGIKPSDLHAVVKRPMVLGVGRLSIEGMGPSVCLLVDGTEGRDQINRTMQAVARLLPRFGVDMKVGREEVAGQNLYRLQIQDGPPVFAGWMGDHYCVSNSRGYLREVAAVAAGQAAGLNASTPVDGLRRQIPSPTLLSGVLNAGSVMESLAPHMPYEAAEFSDALGLGRVDVIYGALAASPRGGADLLHVGLHGSEHGLFKSLVAEPADLSFARTCSENTVLFGAGSFDVPAVISAFHRFVELLPAEAQREIQREMGREFSRELRRAGTSPQEVHAMLNAFGSQIGMALSLERGAVPKPELLVRIAVKDADAVTSLLQRIEAMSSREGGLEWRTRKVEGHELRYCNVAIEDQLQLSPCYLLTDDALWIGSDAGGLTRSLKRAGDADDSLAAQEDFKRLERECAGASGVLHVRTFRGVEIGWRSVETMLYPMVDAKADELGFDSSVLPDRDQLAAAVGTTTFAYQVDDAGVTVRTEGPLTMAAWVAVIGSWADRVLARASSTVF